MWPRCLNSLANNNLFFIDGGDGNGFEMDLQGNIIKMYKGKDEPTQLAMKKARFIYFNGNSEEIFISNNLNSRILKIKSSTKRF